jgi:uncharacterized protein with PQ loop repeat
MTIANIFNALQFIGGILLSISYIPQFKQIIKTKSVKDLNLSMFFQIFIGIILMEVNAIYLALQGMAVMFLVTNTISMALSGVMCLFILKYRVKKS